MTLPRYILKYRGKEFYAESENQMIDSIIKYYDGKVKITREELYPIVNKNIKETKNRFKGNDGGAEKLNKVHEKRITWKDALKGASAILKNTVGYTTTDEEISRRSKICAACPLKSLTTDCYACGFASRLNKFIGDLKTTLGFGASLPNDVKGGYCKVCKCALAVMIPSKMSAFNESQIKQDERPDHCWLKNGSYNFINDK